MKKTLQLICLAAIAIILFFLLPYLPPTFFSTLLVVGCMVALAIWGNILCKAPKTPVLTEEELDNLDELLEEEEAEGEAVSDNGETVEITVEGVADIVHQKKLEEAQQAPKRINIQELEKQRRLANERKRKKSRKQLAKHSKRQNR